MPDENANPIGGTQISQDNQATTNQSWNDFVLDFGEWEEMITANNVDDTNDVKFGESDMSMDNMWFWGENLVSQDNTAQEINQEDLFWETKEENEDTSNQVDLENFYVSEQEDKQGDSFDLWFENESPKEENLNLDTENVGIEQRNGDLLSDGESYDFNTSLAQNNVEESLNLQDNAVQWINEAEPNWDVSEELDLDKSMETVEASQENVNFLNEADNPSVSEDNFEEIKSEEKVEEPEENFVFNEVENENQAEDKDVLEEKAEKTEEILMSTEENVNQRKDSEEAEQKEEVDQGYLSDSGEVTNQVENEDKLEENAERLAENQIPDEENNNQIENKEWLEEKVEEKEENFVLNGEDAPAQPENKEESMNNDTNFVLNDNSWDNNIFQEIWGKDQNEENVGTQNDNPETVQNENPFENVENNGEDSNELRFDVSEESLSDNSNDNQDSIVIENSQTDWDFVLNDSTSENENINENVNKFQDNEPISDSNPISNDWNTQPDMMDLLWWQSVDFSYEENAAAVQQSENNLEMPQASAEDYQAEVSSNSQNLTDPSVENNENTISNWLNNSVVEEKSDLNIANPQVAVENTNVLQNTETTVPVQNNQNSVDNTNASMTWLWANIDNQNVVQNPIVNNTNETPLNATNSAPQTSENIPNQAEIWQVKATLSLDEILDSELLSNPQFADNSKAVPNNVIKKSNKTGISVFTWVWVLALLWFVAVLAFPSISAERKAGDTVDTWTVMEEPEIPTRYTPDEPENFENKPEVAWDDSGIIWKAEDSTWTHGISVEIEVIDDETGDDVEDVSDENSSDEETTGDGSVSSIEIVPYVVEIEKEEPEIQEITTISKNDIQQKISTFKTKGEKYKKMGEDDSNEKVIKYSTYIIRLCEEYEENIENEEWINEETFSEFETKVNGFLSKIEKNLGLEEVETIYSN